MGGGCLGVGGDVMVWGREEGVGRNGVRGRESVEEYLGASWDVKGWKGDRGNY